MPPEFVIALVSHLKWVIEREYWNKYQEPKNLSFEKIDNKSFQVFLPTVWMWYIESDWIRITYDEIYWKNMKSNKELSNDEWIQWFDDFLKIMKKVI